MIDTNIYKSARARCVLAIAILLLLVTSGSIFLLLQARENKTNPPGTATPQTEKKVTPTSTPTTEAANQPLFFDDFTTTSKGWYLGSVAGYTRAISNNTLILADVNHKILTESLPTNSIFTDFAVTATFTLGQANGDDSVGLYLRGDSNLDHDYRLDVYGNNTYAISKEFLDGSKVPQVQFLVAPTKSASLKPEGQQNTITVVMKGPKLILQINGTMVNAVSDGDYTSGQIALFVQNSETSSGVEASFNSVGVYSAPD